MTSKPLQIKALGEWSVREHGRPALGGPNLTIVLHALILGRGRVYREDIIDRLAEHERGADHQDGALRNALSKLRAHGLDIPQRQNPVVMNVSQAMAKIDLWEFFTHVKFGRYPEAYELISDGQEPFLLAGTEDPDNSIWRDTLTEFQEARAETMAALEAQSGRQRSTLATRERLLGRSFVPGVGRHIPIRDVRDRVEGLKAPWRQERPTLEEGRGGLPEKLAEVISGEGLSPQQAVVVGGIGAGKTLVAISTFLHLSEMPSVARDGRAILYVDAEREAPDPEFGSEDWLHRRLHDLQAEGCQNPIVVIPHGDAFLANQRDLAATLERSLFRDHDILLCCGESFYTRRLSFEEFGTHVVHLEPWDEALQRSFALALGGRRLRNQFVEWLEQEGGRRRLCSVPLHLVHVLALLAEESEVIAEVSTAPQLIEGVAHLRLSVTRPPFPADQLLVDLSSTAHRFYLDATASETGIRFTVEELRIHLSKTKRKQARRRTDCLVNETFIRSVPGSALLRFEQGPWGRFFVARHIVRTVIYRPAAVLQTFSKLLSADLIRLCEAMLREKLPRYGAEINDCLRRALVGSGSDRAAPGRSTIARGQVAYLLGALADKRSRNDLGKMAEPDSPRSEPDPLVRMALQVGLASAGVMRFADLFVDALRAERHAGGSAPERDANIAFTLNLCGDAAFDPERPGRIRRSVDPARTVTALVRRLEERRGSGAWRIVLFDLVDLARHPNVSTERFECAMSSHRHELEAILDCLKSDPRRQLWPELRELEELLSVSPARASEDVLRPSS